MKEDEAAVYLTAKLRWYVDLTIANTVRVLGLPKTRMVDRRQQEQEQWQRLIKVIQDLTKQR